MEALLAKKVRNKGIYRFFLGVGHQYSNETLALINRIPETFTLPCMFCKILLKTAFILLRTREFAVYNLIKYSFRYFKEELGLKHEIEECSLIRSKCYSLKLRERKTSTHSSVNKCKGVKKRKVEGLPYECYKSVLVNLGSQNTMQTVLRSYNHNMYTLNMTKRMFTSFEDKTYLK